MTGRLVAIMGPSGAGKDTLIAYARARSDPARVFFAHRYITRPAASGGENHVALSEAEFRARRDAGLFALSWESHGFAYGIGRELDLWLAAGVTVVANIARAAWDDAARSYPRLSGVLVTAAPAVLAHRLAARGREDEAAIAERLAREVPLPPHLALHTLDNSGDIAVAGDALLRLLATA
ncbi:MAG TPA: phosphonate metabolism protein/1,5-bisphosphokinase (PRPP-forming) PhnN [Stellaceae bacterium]|jgi:ribose 1,5-bisphosphokinase|nr:phosphonate metabolism protein/1,5-bisphosphokinase (PRPP-forming) PhnN [Stellaceae bacterium]